MPTRASLAIHADEINASFLKNLKSPTPFFDQVLLFHYSPKQIKKKYNIAYKENKSKGTPVKVHEYSRTDPIIFRFTGLLFNDWGLDRPLGVNAIQFDDISTVDVPGQIKRNLSTEALNNLGATDRQLISNERIRDETVVRYKNVEQSLNQLRNWTAAQSPGGIPPVLDLTNVDKDVFVCFISDLKIKHTIWHPRTKQIMRATVDLELTESVLGGRMAIVGQGGGLTGMDYRVIALEQIKSPGTLVGPPENPRLPGS